MPFFDRHLCQESADTSKVAYGMSRWTIIITRYGSSAHNLEGNVPISALYYFNQSVNNRTIWDKEPISRKTHVVKKLLSRMLILVHGHSSFFYGGGGRGG